MFNSVKYSAYRSKCPPYSSCHIRPNSPPLFGLLLGEDNFLLPSPPFPSPGVTPLNFCHAQSNVDTSGWRMIDGSSPGAFIEELEAILLARVGTVVSVEYGPQGKVVLNPELMQID